MLRFVKPPPPVNSPTRPEQNPYPFRVRSGEAILATVRRCHQSPKAIPDLRRHALPPLRALP